MFVCSNHCFATAKLHIFGLKTDEIKEKYKGKPQKDANA